MACGFGKARGVALTCGGACLAGAVAEAGVMEHRPGGIDTLLSGNGLTGTLDSQAGTQSTCAAVG